MAKKRLKIRDRQGNVVDYDISAASVTIDVEGKSLEVKLTEIAAAILERVNRVVYNGNTHIAEGGIVNLGNQMQPDWNENSTTYPSFIRNKPNFAPVATSGSYNDLRDKPQSVDIECDAQMSSTSENPVQNKVIKAYVDAVSARIDTLIGSGNVQGAIDTFNEVVSFLAGISSSDTLAAKLAQLASDISGKVDKVNGKGLSTEDYTTEEKSKLAGLSNDYENLDNTPNLDDFLTESDFKTINNESIVGSGNINIQGQKGDKGDKGDTVVVDTSGLEQFDIINGLNAQSAGNALDAYQGAQLKAKINEVYAKLKAVYNALGNIAFWEGKPAVATILPDLDWGLPKHTVTLDLSLTNAVVYHNGVVVADGDTIQVEEYETLTLTIEGASGYVLNSVVSQVGTVSQDLSTITLVIGQSDVTLDITATAVMTYSISYGTMTNCSIVTSPAPTSIVGGDSVGIEFSADSGYQLDASCFTVNNADKAWNPSTNVLTISNPTGNVNISATAEVPKLKFLKGYIISSNGVVTNEPFYQGATTSGLNLTTLCAVSDYIQVPPPSSPVTTNPVYSVYWGVRSNNSTLGPLARQWSLFRKEANGTFTFLEDRAWDDSTTYKADRGGSLQATIDAYNAGTLYLRSTIYRSSDGTTLMRGQTYGIKVGSTVLFMPSETNNVPNNYRLVDATDWDVDDLTS